MFENIDLTASTNKENACYLYMHRIKLEMSTVFLKFCLGVLSSVAICTFIREYICQRYNPNGVIIGFSG